MSGIYQYFPRLEFPIKVIIGKVIGCFWHVCRKLPMSFVVVILTVISKNSPRNEWLNTDLSIHQNMPRYLWGKLIYNKKYFFLELVIWIMKMVFWSTDQIWIVESRYWNPEYDWMGNKRVKKLFSVAELYSIGNKFTEALFSLNIDRAWAKT